MMKRYGLFAAVLLASASTASLASESVSRETGVGPWIAAQGNAALREIAEELKEGLAERLRPLLPPAHAPRAQAKPAGSAQPRLIEV